MQSIFSSWAISVTIAVLFSAVVSSLLPDTSIKKYITVVLGVIITIFMLSPLFKLFSGTDFGQELNNAVNNMSAISEQKTDMNQYTDYIFKVYMGDE
jgi:stage III sporulation protein AF